MTGVSLTTLTERVTLILLFSVQATKKRLTDEYVRSGSKFQSVVWTSFNTIDVEGNLALAPLTWSNGTGRKTLAYGREAGLQFLLWHQTQSLGIVSESLGVSTKKVTEAPITEDVWPGLITLAQLTQACSCSL